MRVLIINTFYYPNMQGGAEQSVKLLAENLVSNGHEVAVFCGDSKSDKLEKETINGVRVYRSNTGKLDLFKACYDKKNVGKIEKIKQKLLMLYNSYNKENFTHVCKDFDPDVIHSNTLFGLSYYLWKIAFKLGIPVVHTVRDTDLVSPVQFGHKCNKLIKIGHRMFVRNITKYVTAVTAPSLYTLRTTLEAGCMKNTIVQKVIENSVVVDTEKLKSVLEEKRNRKGKIIRFLYVGRLVYFKGIKHLLEAFSKYDDPDVRLVICGDGEMKDYVIKYANEDSRIHYMGKLNNNELEEAYQSADVLIVPSEWPEPFGRVVIEGNINGLPVIAGRFGGIPEIIQQMKSGVLYDNASAANLLYAMKSFSRRSYYLPFYDNIEDNISYYSIERQIQSFLKVYEEIRKEK